MKTITKDKLLLRKADLEERYESLSKSQNENYLKEREHNLTVLAARLDELDYIINLCK